MPSLRRTVSSPMVRASPYPSLSAGAPTPGAGMTAATRIRRACSGSEPNSARRSRTVLADIEWWRVLDGQHAEDSNNGVNGADADQVQVRQIDTEAAASGATSALDDVGGMMHASEWDATDMDVALGEPGVSTFIHPSIRPVYLSGTFSDYG